MSEIIYTDNSQVGKVFSEIIYTDLLPEDMILEMKDDTLIAGTGEYKKTRTAATVRV